MTLSELVWEEYKKGVCLKILKLACRIIEERTEKLEEKLSEGPEIGFLSKNLQDQFQKELEDLYKIIEMLCARFPSEILSIDFDKLDPESKSRIKRAISGATKRLRPLDQKGILETLKTESEKVPRADKSY